MKNFKTALFLIVSIVISILVLANTFSLPNIKGKDTDLKQFSATRAMEVVENIAKEPHPIETEENKQVRNYLVERLKSLGLNPELQEMDHKSRLANYKQVENSGHICNIIARLKGSGEERDAIALVSHYDSVKTSPGAGDASSGVATIIETVRALKEKGTLKNDIIILLTDGEEKGLLGANAFIQKYSDIKDVKLVVNLDARGNSGPAIMFETGINNSKVLNAYETSVKTKFASSASYEVYRNMKTNTDFTEFKAVGINGLNFANGQGAYTYHSMKDTIENYNVKTLQHFGENILGVMSYLGNADLKEINNSNHSNVYFNFTKNIFINYSDKLTIPLAAGVAILLIILIKIAVKKEKIKLKNIFKGAIEIGFFLALIYLVVMFLNSLIQFILSKVTRFEDFQYQAQIQEFIINISKPIMIFYIIVTVVLLVGIIKILKKHMNNTEIYIAALTLWSILMILTSIWFKGVSYLFTWTTLIFVLTMIEMVWFDRSKYSNVINYISVFINIFVTMNIYGSFLWLMYIAFNMARAPLHMVLIGVYGVVIGTKVLEICSEQRKSNLQVNI